MSAYLPEKFGKYFNENGGAAIWEWLNQPDSVLRMETATYLKRPAAEALSPALLARFGAPVQVDHTKRMIGHMIKQVMENRGHPWERNGVSIRTKGNIFSTAARYSWNGETEEG